MSDILEFEGGIAAMQGVEEAPTGGSSSSSGSGAGAVARGGAGGGAGAGGDSRLPESSDAAAPEDVSEEEEAVPVRAARDPGAPTAAERAEHEATHLPYRVWCHECVAGRADTPGHKRVVHEECEIPTIGMDYMFMRRDGEEDTITALVMKDYRTRAVMSWVVPVKGADVDNAVERAVEGLLALGYRERIVLRTDGEPALLALREAVINKYPGEVMKSEPAPGESASNGATENAVRLVKGMLRVHLLALERRLGVRLPSGHPVLSWLVEHAGDLISKYLRGKDGRTSYERLYGRALREEGLVFGERVLYRRKHAVDQNVALEARWLPGLWLGRKWGTHRHRVHTAGDGVVEVRAVQRRPLPERWDVAALNEVRATPWCLRPGPAGDGHEVRILPALPEERRAAAPEPVAEAPEYRPHRVYILPADLDRWGYTAGCRRCGLMRAGGRTQGVPHKQACRERIEAAMREAGDVRIERAEARFAEASYEAAQPAAEEDGAAAAPALGAAAGPAADAPGADAAPARLPESADGFPVAANPGVYPPVGASDLKDEEDAVTVPDHEAQDMVDFLDAGVPEKALQEATSLYELLLVSGAAAPVARAKVSELYSPPRVTRELEVRPRPWVIQGSTFDLEHDRAGRRWDLSRPEVQAEVLRTIEHERPYLVIGSPPCAGFSALNEGLNYPKLSPEEVARRKAPGRQALQFAARVYRLQLASGRHFLHEHPASASSWREPCMRALLRRKGVATARTDQCMFGQTVVGADGRLGAALKPTTFVSSAPAVLEQLARRCDGRHHHVRLLGGRAAGAAIYPPRLCRAVLSGVEVQLRREGAAPAGAHTGAVYALHEGEEDDGGGIGSIGPELIVEEGEPDRVQDEEEVLAALAAARGCRDPAPCQGVCRDDLTGAELPPELVHEARMEEVRFMDSWRVWDVVPRAGHKVIGGKWVNTNKGDATAPDVRCRYVAKEIAFSHDDAFFCATPPVEALRMLVSHVASSPNERLLIMDAKKAHLHAPAKRELYVELPREVAQPGMCGRLRRCLYGTRDAPAQWEAYLAAALVKMGFTQGVASPCCFFHKERGLRCVVHGDDFSFAGSAKDLQWIEAELPEKFLIKRVGLLGPGCGEDREVRVLNRVVRWTEQGIEMEADPRHAELLVAGLAAAARPLSTPGIKEDAAALDLTPLNMHETGLFRSYAARALYLSLDRPDLAYSCKELCRRMSAPVQGDLAALRRVARYLLQAPRVVLQYPWQESAYLDVYVDTDFAGCATTRRSTSGGCALRGAHALKHWATTQKTVTLSSGEAELSGLVKGVAEGMGLRSLAADLGVEVRLRVHTDSSAAVGICRRAGIGRVRHLAVGQLWVQGRLKAGDFALHKVAGLQNPADLCTKYLAAADVVKHLRRLGVAHRAGRAATAPQVTAEVDTTLAE